MNGKDSGPVDSLTPEELLIIKLIREKQFQELTVKIQGGIIVMIERTERFARKNGKMS